MTVTEFSGEFVQTARGLLDAPVEVRRELQARGINITRSNFYSNIPTVEEVEGSFEYQSNEEIYNTGLFDQEKIRQFVADTLSRWSHEFCPPTDGDRENPSGYFWNAPSFSYSDAMAYYCMITESGAGGWIRLLHTSRR